MIVFEINTFEFFKTESFIRYKKVEPKIPYSSIFKMKLEKSIVIFDASTIEFFKMLNFVRNKKVLNLGLKVPYLGIFKL